MALKCTPYSSRHRITSRFGKSNKFAKQTQQSSMLFTYFLSIMAVGKSCKCPLGLLLQWKCYSALGLFGRSPLIIMSDLCFYLRSKRQQSCSTEFTTSQTTISDHSVCYTTTRNRRSQTHKC